MHPEVRQYVSSVVDKHGPFARVLEVGAQNVNGTVRDLFGGADYFGVDPVAGPGVDYVGAFEQLQWVSGWVDCIVSTEVLEHHPKPWEIIRTAYRVLRHNGILILTMAGPGRSPHGAHGAASPAKGEHYANVDPLGLEGWLSLVGFDVLDLDVLGADLRATALKGW